MSLGKDNRVSILLTLLGIWVVIMLTVNTDKCLSRGRVRRLFSVRCYSLVFGRPLPNWPTELKCILFRLCRLNSVVSAHLLNCSFSCKIKKNNRCFVGHFFLFGCSSVVRDVPETLVWTMVLTHRKLNKIIRRLSFDVPVKPAFFPSALLSMTPLPYVY